MEGVLFLLLLVAGILAVRYYRQKSRLQKEKFLLDKTLSEQKAAYKKLQSDTLRFQLTPHAFRNTLSTLKYFTKTANQAVEHISEVLDYILYESNTQAVSIEQELKFLDEYINLNKLQVNKLNAITIKNNINNSHPLFTKPTIPPLVTAYFIENAFKHGGPCNNNLRIKINCKVIDETILQFEILNNFVLSHKTKTKKGIGLSNTKKRLKLIFQNNFTLEKTVKFDYYIIRLQIPVQNED